MKRRLLYLGLLVYSLFAMEPNDDAKKKALAHVSGQIKRALDIGSSSEQVPPLRVSLDQISVLPQEWKEKLEGIENSGLVLQLAQTNQASGFPVEKQEYLSEVGSTVGQWGSSDERSEDLKSIVQSFPQISNTSVSHSSSEESSSSSVSADSVLALATPQKDDVKKLVRQLMAESYEKYDEKQRGKILWGKRVTGTAVVILALAILANLVEIGVIITETVLSCAGV